MSVAFGVVTETMVLTPKGPVAASQLAVGDEVVAHDPATQTTVHRTIQVVHQSLVTQLVDLVTSEASLTGVTPGTNVWDAFDEMYRAAASLSPLAELLGRSDAGLQTAPILEVPEREVPPTQVIQFAIEGDEGAYFAGGFLVKAALKEG